MALSPLLFFLSNPWREKSNGLGLVRFRRIAPGIVPANQSLYKLEKQSGQESFRPTNPAETNKVLGLIRLRRIAPGIVPANQSLYKLEKQSG
jgi:hypothetical protein